MRLFIAIEIAPEIRAALREYMERTQAAVPNTRLVRPEGLHVTLKFLGEVPPERVTPLQRNLQSIHADAFSLTLAGTGFFPTPQRPRIFWVALGSDPAAALDSLAHQVDTACAEAGFAREQRPYQPHVTLARFAPGKAAARTPPEAPNSFGMMRAAQFHLYQSQLHPKGAIYTKIASFPLLANS